MTRRPLRILAAVLVAAILVNLMPAGLPLFGTKTASADPGTYLDATPSVFSSYGGYTVLEWDYDFGHWTLIDIYRNGSLVFNTRDWFDGGINHYVWYGQSNDGSPLEDGDYTVYLTPDDEFSMYYQTTTVRIYNPPPEPPTVTITKDASGNIIARGTAEPGATIRVYVNNSPAGTTTADSSGNWQELIWLEPDSINTVTATASARGKTSGTAPEERVLVHGPAPGETPAQTADYYLQNGGDTTSLLRDNGGSIEPGELVIVKDPVRQGEPTTTVPVEPWRGSGYGSETFAGKTYDPVNTSTGAFMLDRTDLIVGGRPGLVFGRSYTSGDPYDGPLGYGWHHSYDIRLVRNADGTIDIFRATGARHRFSPTSPGSDTYEPETPGVFDVLTKNDDETYSLLLQDNTTQVFDSSGLLTRIFDRNGNEVTLTYERGYLLKKVTSSGGTFLEFTYNEDARIESVADSSGRGFR